MNDAVSKFIAGFAILAVLYMLVRPGSPATQAVKDVSDALSQMVKTATGYTGRESGPGTQATV